MPFDARDLRCRQDRRARILAARATPAPHCSRGADLPAFVRRVGTCSIRSVSCARRCARRVSSSCASRPRSSYRRRAEHQTQNVERGRARLHPLRCVGAGRHRQRRPVALGPVRSRCRAASASCPRPLREVSLRIRAHPAVVRARRRAEGPRPTDDALDATADPRHRARCGRPHANAPACAGVHTWRGVHADTAPRARDCEDGPTTTERRAAGRVASAGGPAVRRGSRALLARAGARRDVELQQDPMTRQLRRLRYV